MIKKYIFLNKIVYSSLNVKEIVIDKILDLFFNNENLLIGEFWTERIKLIELGNNFIKQNNLE